MRRDMQGKRLAVMPKKDPVYTHTLTQPKKAVPLQRRRGVSAKKQSRKRADEGLKN